MLNKLGRNALAASPPSKSIFYTNSAIDRQNTPVKVPGKTQSKFYVSNDLNGHINSVQSRFLDLQNRSRQAVNRLMKVSEAMEQQVLPQQSPIIIELRSIASLLSNGLEEATFIEPPQKLPSRSNSVSKPDESQRKSTLNGKECEMVEMHFARMKNY